MTKESVLAEIGKVLNTARRAAVQYKRLTGKPLGITGEVAEYEAARILELTLTEARQEGFDARKGGKRIQIKGRVLGKNAGAGQRIGTIRLDKKWDSVVLVLLDEQFLPTEIYEAGRKKIKAALIAPGSKARNERGQLSVSKFKSIGRPIWLAEGAKPERGPRKRQIAAGA